MHCGLQNAKHAQEDDVLPDGTKVKKGTMVAFHPYGMGRMPYIWGADAAEFKPERWIKDGVFVPESPFKYIAFQVRVFCKICSSYPINDQSQVGKGGLLDSVFYLTPYHLRLVGFCIKMANLTHII